jgi:hypothetical protein
MMKPGPKTIWAEVAKNGYIKKTRRLDTTIRLPIKLWRHAKKQGKIAPYIEKLIQDDYFKSLQEKEGLAQ